MQYADYAGAPSGALAIPLKARGGGIRAWVLVDEADFEWASSFNWHLDSNGYARRNVSPRESGLERWHLSRMHRELLGLERGDKREGDHINRNRLDNRRSNLRVVTHEQNQHNQSTNKRPNRKSQYRGVSKRKEPQYHLKPWVAYCRLRGTLKTVGYFATELEAHEAVSAFRRVHMTHSTD